MKRKSIDSLVALQIAVAAFFLLIGLVGIVDYNADASRFGRAVVRFFGGRNDAIAIVVSVLSLASGIVMLLGLFTGVDERISRVAAWGVFVFWSLHILYFFFFNNIFEPDFLVWLRELAPEVVILISIWIVARRYA